MSADMALVQAYLANVQIALQNVNAEHAQTLLESMQNLMNPLVPLSSPMHISVGIGLDAGVKRKGKPNEDFAWAASGFNGEMQERYGLFIVADGMGGHADGCLASRLAVETIVSIMVPHLQNDQVQVSNLGNVLSNAVVSANAVINARNQGASDSLGQMGSTVTAVVTFGFHTFIANVGDSRTYLYRPTDGLRQVTRDHSHVADLVAIGQLAPDAVYTHCQRHYIYRCLGVDFVEVDLFSEQIQDGDILLLCSDGMWESTRNTDIEQILQKETDSSQMARDLVQLAITGGGPDNIGVVIAQFQMDTAQMPTVRLSPLSSQVLS